MIAHITGPLSELHPTHVIIEAGGLGYEVRISLATFDELKNVAEGSPVRLLTYLQIKEDAHTLFGFQSAAEKSLFLHLLGVSGVGAATALAVLSSLSVAEAQQAIVKEDVRTLQRVKGLGAKGAQRIVLDLRDKLKKEGITGSIVPAGGAASSASVAERLAGNKNRAEALAALTTLGFARAAAEKSLDTIIEQRGSALRVEEMIKFALKSG
ncbi:MAG: Holliday junction branch migration protein RuvA [Hymenobacteraceae bacterium]|nr:Holliday junction branch migration protein RuvA [Hymenobacteraceae bacterium]